MGTKMRRKKRREGRRITQEMKAASLQMCRNVRFFEPFQVQPHNFIWTEV